MEPAELASILAAARSEVAAGREPDGDALEARIRAAGGGRRELQQLERVLTVHRARARLAAPPAPPAAAPQLRPRPRAAFRAQPTITGNMEVRRHAKGETVTLSWDGTKAIARRAAISVEGWKSRTPTLMNRYEAPQIAASSSTEGRYRWLTLEPPGPPAGASPVRRRCRARRRAR